jgi:hypothetical protein
LLAVADESRKSYCEQLADDSRISCSAETGKSAKKEQNKFLLQAE